MPTASTGLPRKIGPGLRTSLDAARVIASFYSPCCGCYPWRIAFLPNGRMLVTEKPGKLWLVTQAGAKREVSGVPRVRYRGQGGLLGVYASPGFASDRGAYLTYAEPGGAGSGLALALATLARGLTGCG